MRRAALLFTLALASTAGAQTPPGGTPPQQQGRGRGRGAVQVMTITTGAFNDGATIPVKFSQAGDETSPPLAWMGAPDSTASFVLIIHDVNAPSGNASDDLLQWMVWNIPGSARSLQEGVPQGPQLPDGTRQISQTGPYYRGPAAPSTGPAHHYLFELYAVDTVLTVPAVGASPAATRAAVVAAMAGHIRGKAVMVGTFKRAAP
ncbi:MAG: YbhB/YbcL family Raf kinase inhibitor-like protein [bacterium]